MMLRSKLETFRTSYDWETTQNRYFRDLAFLDVAESLPNLGRQREISEKEAKSGTYCSKAYFDAQGRLLRLDQVGSGTIPSEVYVEYTDGVPIRAAKFRLGIGFYGKFVSESPEISDEWTYKYDENGCLTELIWHSFPSLNFKYGYHYNESFTHEYFEYDAEGLLRISQQHKGLTVDGRPFCLDKVVTYDRIRRKLLSRHTVSKTAWVPILKQRKNQIPFVFGGSPRWLGVESPTCCRCGQLLTFICEVRLDQPLKNRSLLTTAPIFYCFDCLEGTTSTKFQTDVDNSEAANRADGVFSEIHLRLGKSTDSNPETEMLIKLGGLPDWIQDEEYPKCAECGQVMMFVCQINSDESIAGSNRVLMFGDMGKLYTFVCCHTVTSVMQCY
ncbi:hypothetical protein [Candidatus Amarolinea dominans]|uniref:hypothetical protein n=1 Tax=Candidatus Amarolinea dominans TaxID=3140696 RepID=UPI001D3C3578|nr:DUF1963 domain-containing protein [Anaerolineae bacterium]